mgnify:CR=1 FL=1
MIPVKIQVLFVFCYFVKLAVKQGDPRLVIRTARKIIIAQAALNEHRFRVEHLALDELHIFHQRIIELLIEFALELFCDSADMILADAGLSSADYGEEKPHLSAELCGKLAKRAWRLYEH